MDHDEQPGFELEQADLYGRYMLTSRMEILFVLRTMVKRGGLATVYYEDGRAFFLTMLLGLDEVAGRVILDQGSDEAGNRAALHASRLIVSATLDRVKIQFRLDRLEPADFDGRPAFAAPTPDTLLRLQRREYYRLDSPLVPPLRCQVPIRREGSANRALELQVLDISAGGVGLMVPEGEAPPFSVDTLLPDCRIALPEEGVLLVTLRVRGAFAATTRNGHPYVRVGCEFVNLPGLRLTMVQRYITRSERERKARISGEE